VPVTIIRTRSSRKDRRQASSLARCHNDTASWICPGRRRRRPQQVARDELGLRSASCSRSGTEFAGSTRAVRVSNMGIPYSSVGRSRRVSDEKRPVVGS